MKRFVTYTINAPHHGLSVQTFLKKVPELSKNQIRSLKFVPDGITVNGQKVRTTYLLKEGDCLTLQLQAKDFSIEKALVPLSRPLDILFENADILVVNKPAGILVHPSGAHYQDTLSNIVSAYFQEKGENVSVRPIGRLDKDTSGAVLFAKNKIAAAFLSDRKQSSLEKAYLAIVSGTPAPARGEISVPICPCGKSPLKMKADPANGKSAFTLYRTQSVLKNGNTLVNLRILTGRTHQIRVHMAYIGHPLVGDPLYGKEDVIFHRAALHAAQIKFHLPFTHARQSVQAPLPDDFMDYLSDR